MVAMARPLAAGSIQEDSIACEGMVASGLNGIRNTKSCFSKVEPSSRVGKNKDRRPKKGDPSSRHGVGRTLFQVCSSDWVWGDCDSHPCSLQFAATSTAAMPFPVPNCFCVRHVLFFKVQQSRHATAVAPWYQQLSLANLNFATTKYTWNPLFLW
jgi:hypothetical protein